MLLKRISALLPLFLLVSAQEPGAPWTSQEKKHMRKKLRWMFENPEYAKTNYTLIYPEHSYQNWVAPNAAKVLRLGFHDCIPYIDGAEQGMAKYIQVFILTVGAN